jgi:hypothetical protein
VRASRRGPGGPCAASGACLWLWWGPAEPPHPPRGTPRTSTRLHMQVQTRTLGVQTRTLGVGTRASSRHSHHNATCTHMPHMAEYTCCSSVAFERPNENAVTFTRPATVPKRAHTPCSVPVQSPRAASPCRVPVQCLAPSGTSAKGGLQHFMWNTRLHQSHSSSSPGWEQAHRTHSTGHSCGLPPSVNAVQCLQKGTRHGPTC